MSAGPAPAPVPSPRPAKGEPLLALSDVRVHFPLGHGTVRAVDGVSFVLKRGETLGLVGESGSGKSTIARAVVGLVAPTDGSILFDGQEIARAGARVYRPLRRRLQMVFQDPYASLNPRMTVASIVGEPLAIHRLVAAPERDARVVELLALVGLDPSMRRRYPHEFSGGQRQRIGLARALAVEPELILLDEPVSALDVSVQAQVLNLLEELKDRLGLSYLFIAHNLAVVKHMSDRVAVLYLGRIVELAARETLYAAPLHPYSEALLSAVPVPDPLVEARRQRIPLTGEIPSPMVVHPGCPFLSRCPKAFERCRSEPPALTEHRPGQWAACHLPEA